MAVTAPRVHARGASATWVPAVLAVVVVAAQIAYPLTPAGALRDRLTVLTVVVFFAASVAHALVFRGASFAAALVAATAGGGLVVEAIGVATGVPFGAYAYNGTLGTAVFGVPVVIPLAWTMMGYPALLVGRRISNGLAGRALWSGAALASWDLFLDPQMVAAGHWTWRGGSGPHLLGVPVVNYLGWFVVATIMMAVLHPLLRDAANVDDRVPFTLYLWTYASSVVAHAAFFGLPGSALVGGTGMGIVVAALLLALRRRK